jgi:hypothetical protein
MSTYSLLLRGPLGRKLTIAEMDGNFLYTKDIADVALEVANEALVAANTGGTTSVLLDPNHNLLAGVDSFFAGGSSQSYILSSNSLISGSKGSTILGGNSVTCNPGDCFTGAPFGGFILGGTNNFITSGDSCSYNYGGNTYIYNNPNASINTSGGSVIGGCSNVNYESNNASIIGGFCNTNEVSCNSSIIGAQNACVCSSNSSSVIGGTNNCLFSSNNSVILGGNGLTLSNVNNTVLVDNLIVKGDLTDYYGNTIVGGGGTASVSINENEVAFGTGDGITSSENFKFDSTNKSLSVGSLNSLCNSIGSNIISSNSKIINSKGSTILGGNSVCNNYEPGVCFYGTYGSCVVGGRNNLITSGDSFSLNFSGSTYIYNSPNQSIISNGGAIIGGGDNSNLYSCNSSIIGGCCNTNNLSNNSSILGGRCNTNNLSNNSNILGGVDNSNIKSCNSSIIGGYYNKISCNNSYSAIIGGASNKISCNNSYSAIIGGANNCLFSSNNSVILGGIGLTLSNVSNTVLVQNLMVKGDLTDYNGNPIVGGGIIQGTYSEILTLKNDGDLVTGQKYKISDVADTGIIIEATSDYNFSHDGVAGFLNADYQNLGNYEGTSIATQSAGLWNINFESPIIDYTSYHLIRWQTNEDVSSLTLNTFTRTNNSVGRITLIEADGSGGYYIHYVVLSSSIDYRNDTQITQDEVTYYSIIAYSDLGQNGISTGQLITTDTGVTASITDSYQNDLYYLELDSKIDLGTSSYFYSDTYVYAKIDGYSLPNTIGKVVIWNQLHFEVVDYASFNGTSPDGNTFSYTSLNKTTTNGYIEEWDKVKYDIDTNSFGLRSDKRGNRLATNNFPWGSNDVLNVVSETSTNNICVVISSNGGEYGGLSDFSDSIIVGGACNTIQNTDCAAILGGYCNIICGNNYGYGYGGPGGGCNPDYSAIVGGSSNKIVASDYSPIIGGYCNMVCESDAGGIFAGCCNRIEDRSCNSTIIGGCDNYITYCSGESSIIGGENNRVSCYSCCSSIIGGRNNFICNGKTSVIMGGATNRVCNTCNSVVSGGDWACLRDTCSSGVFAGAGNRIVGASMSCTYRNAIVGGHCGHICTGSCDSTIMGGCRNVISCSSNSSSIMGGCFNIINGSDNSAIIGGNGLTLENESNKVLVPQLKIDQVDLNLGNSKLLTIDAVGNVNFRTFDSFTSSGGIVVGATDSMTGFMNQIYASSNGSVVGGGYNCVCCNSNNSSIIGGSTNVINNFSPSTSIIGGHFNFISNTCDSSIIGGFTNSITTGSYCSSIIGGRANTICYGAESSTIISGYYNKISYGSCDSVISGGCGNCIIYSSRCSSIVSGVGNRIDSSCISSVIGGYCNSMCCSHCSTIIGGYDNRICGYDGNEQFGSSILGGAYNEICDGTNNSSIIGGYSNVIYGCSCNSTIVGGCNNGICDFSCNSTVIGGCNNYICCSSNSVILGGQDLDIYQRPNTVFLNGTTNFKQTVEVSVSDTISASPYPINFNEGAVKYLSTLSTDFQINFTNIPTIANTTITYTLILNQGVTPYMITGLTINAGSLETIKWANATAPEGNASQVDIVGLMFIYDGSGVLSQVLGQIGTFA